MKLLIVASEPIDANGVELITSKETPDEVRVIAPALTGSALRYWTNDTDKAIERSEKIVNESLSELDDAGIKAAAHPVTDDEPAVTIDDALRVFDPDRIVVVKHGPGDEAYREDQIVGEIKGMTDVPVEVFAAESTA